MVELDAGYVFAAVGTSESGSAAPVIVIVPALTGAGVCEQLETWQSPCVSLGQAAVENDALAEPPRIIVPGGCSAV